MKKPKQTQLNPNWVQLQQKLKLNAPKASRSFNDSDEDTPTTISGKHKERPDDESNDCQINPLTPVKDDASLADAVAMDCEMVGVGEGNKSALGRVTLVLILGVHVTDFGRSWISKHDGAVSLPKNETVPAVIVFGDSVVDPGNNNYINTIVKCNFPPYGREFGGGNQPTGRFSNGLVPSDIIASKFGVKKLMPAYLDPNLQLQDLLTGVSSGSGGAGYDPLTSKIAGVQKQDKGSSWRK